ncbi:hypothetical protein GGR54DRAFT_346347 [Hypoxylon sp. NC1633]|nr:hypothetical protein GGR54DRAFT_346347 [Hypoxylon sp. NC1633]
MPSSTPRESHSRSSRSRDADNSRPKRYSFTFDLFDSEDDEHEQSRGTPNRRNRHSIQGIFTSQSHSDGRHTETNQRPRRASISSSTAAVFGAGTRSSTRPSRPDRAPRTRTRPRQARGMVYEAEDTEYHTAAEHSLPQHFSRMSMRDREEIDMAEQFARMSLQDQGNSRRPRRRSPTRRVASTQTDTNGHDQHTAHTPPLRPPGPTPPYTRPLAPVPVPVFTHGQPNSYHDFVYQQGLMAGQGIRASQINPHYTSTSAPLPSPELDVPPRQSREQQPPPQRSFVWRLIARAFGR